MLASMLAAFADVSPPAAALLAVAPPPSSPSAIDARNVDFAYRAVLLLLSACLIALLLMDIGCSCEGRSVGWSSVLRRSSLEAVFLPAYAICASADWLQGPYVFALYKAYGFDRPAVNMLFMIGFVSAGVIAPFAGGLADRYGRRASCVVGYCGLYGLACLTKHFRSYFLLLLGRVLGGAATSVLFSSFESWLVAQHEAVGLPPAELSAALSRMYFLNGLSGILMGLLAEAGADASELRPWGGPSSILYFGGDVTPFDMSLCFLLLGGVLIQATWAENYSSAPRPPRAAAAAAAASTGTTSSSVWQAALADLHPSRLFAPGSSVAEARSRLAAEPLLWLLMAASATMEGAMYAFVLEWTPAVGSTAGKPPLGVIFATFMVAYMGGSTCVAILVRDPKRGVAPSTILVFIVGAALLSVLACFLLLFSAPEGDEKPPAIAFAVFLALCAFEWCLGAYMPTIAQLKAAYVPDDVRATVYSIFRVPLNAIVVGVLLVSLTSATTFLLCSGLLVVCLAAAVTTMRTVRRREHSAVPYTGELGASSSMSGAQGRQAVPAIAVAEMMPGYERTPLVTSSRTSSTC